MKTKSLGRSRWLVHILCGLYATLTFGFLTCKSDAQITVIDFENIPPVYTPVESFGGLLPGVTLSSGGQWIAGSVASSYFENMYGRAITAFPDGAAALSIGFDHPVQDVRMDFGSGYFGVSLTIGVTGYRNNQVLFSDTFTTHAGPNGADEVRAQTFGIVDMLVVARTAGDANLAMDNLAFAGVPEPQALSLLLTGAFAGLSKRGRSRTIRHA